MLHHRNYFATGPAFNGSHITNLPAIGDTINLPVVTDGNPITEALAQRHPSYSLSLLELYRLTYTGGRDFVLKYLVKRYDENEKAWDDRLKLTYCPAFAKDAIQEYIRSLVQRSNEIDRVGGNKGYLTCCEGKDGGVDRSGLSMNAWLQKYVVGELMAMGRVAIYVDNDNFFATTRVDEAGRHPYLYTYTAEDILNWSYDDKGELSSILLRERSYKYNALSLPCGTVDDYRHIHRGFDPNWSYASGVPPTHGVIVDTYTTAGQIISRRFLDLPRLPVHLATLPQSLLADVADYQVALLNLASSDIYYVWSANFPLYVEQRPAMDINRMLDRRTVGQDGPIAAANRSSHGKVVYDMLSQTEYTVGGDPNAVNVGTIDGRTYPIGSDRPGWVAPPTDPLIASMNKEEQIKTEIRHLVALAISNLYNSEASADTKKVDRESGIESGLAGLGSELEFAENAIAAIWHLYTSDQEVTHAKYPAKYDLRSEADRRQEAKDLAALQNVVASKTHAKQISQQIVRTLHKDKVTDTVLNKMMTEIQDAKVPTADPEILKNDAESGFVSRATASIGRGYEECEAEKAAEELAERQASILASQTSAGARGVQDLEADPSEAKDEKAKSQDPDTSVDASSGKHGKYATTATRTMNDGKTPSRQKKK